MCLLSYIIINVSYQSLRTACLEILDRQLELGILDSVREGAEKGLVQALKETGETGLTLGRVEGTKSGACYIVDVVVEGPGTFTLDRMEKIKECVERGIMKKVRRVKIVRFFMKLR
jgi:divalent metal cation (Fe/Co/Zn/Cd) transporter